MLTAKANKIHKPRPRGKKLLGGLDATAENRETLKLGGATVRLPKLLAIDTETTGIDLYHGCRPFFVSTCDADGNLAYWEWDVNPLTRNVGHCTRSIDKHRDSYEISPFDVATGGVFVLFPPKNDRAELADLIKANRFVLHNTKFDTHALETSGFPRINLETCHDTLIASHVLCSNESHDLKDLGLKYLDIRDDDQQELREATNEARRIARQLGWAVAEGPHLHFPATKQAPGDGWWIMDTWLPRMVAKYKWEVEGAVEFAPASSTQQFQELSGSTIGYAEFQPGHPWWTVLRRYALRDVERTYGLYWCFMEELDKQGLMGLYEERRQNIAAVYDMERNGVTLNADRMEAVSEKLLDESENMAEICFGLAGKAPQPPKPKYSAAEFKAMKKKEREKAIAPFVFDNLNSPKQLETLLFDCWNLRTTKRTGAGNRSTDAEVLAGLKERATGEPKKFVENLTAFRKRDKALAYINEYRLRSLQPGDQHFPDIYGDIEEDPTAQFLHIRGNFNITGTDTIRFSSSHPNFQNISKKEYEDDNGVVIRDLNLRRMFGPAPGREWYSGDYSNIELRIFAWESGDEQLIEAFKSGYSVHLIFAEILYPEQWRKHPGEAFKTEYESTWYQWVKNGNFSLIYGAGEGKADRTYHKDGAYRLIRNRMPNIDNFLSTKYQEALVHSFITCLGGYKLYVPVSEPHKAVNYFVQGSAGWFMCTAINRIHRYLSNLNREVHRDAFPRSTADNKASYKMIMTIHDELVFDFPKHPRNLEVITHIAKLMEQSGKPFGIPTPVQFDLHADNWADGQKLKLAV